MMHDTDPSWTRGGRTLFLRNPLSCIILFHEDFWFCKMFKKIWNFHTKLVLKDFQKNNEHFHLQTFFLKKICKRLEFKKKCMFSANCPAVLSLLSSPGRPGSPVLRGDLSGRLSPTSLICHVLTVLSWLSCLRCPTSVAPSRLSWPCCCI